MILPENCSALSVLNSAIPEFLTGCAEHNFDLPGLNSVIPEKRSEMIELFSAVSEFCTGVLNLPSELSERYSAVAERLSGFADVNTCGYSAYRQGTSRGYHVFNNNRWTLDVQLPH